MNHTALSKPTPNKRTFGKSNELNERFHKLIPGGAHTYAKGDDQFPEFMAPIITRGKGCHVWDVDGNEFIEYGMGLRAITLGHAYEPVTNAAAQQMQLGNNFVRPAAIELEAAERFLSFIKGAEMVKFGKNGSDATSAAIKLSRAYTGRDRVAICASHPFFSVDDWFIGSTAMAAGIPQVIRDLTMKFTYNDLQSVEGLFSKFPGQIACLIMEPEKDVPPSNNFLHEVQRLCSREGSVFVLDEMINGFRWHNGGGQAFYDIVPDLATFGKGMGNGFSISALAGKKEIMKLGGLRHDKQRVFLLSLTHGAEAPTLAAALEVMKIYREKPIVKTLWQQGERLQTGVNNAISDLRLDGFIELIGRPCNLVYATRDQDQQPSQPFRTLFLQETIRRGLLAPSLVVSYSHTDQDIDMTVSVFREAFEVYRKALDEGVEKHLMGRPVKPVFRQFN